MSRVIAVVGAAIAAGLGALVPVVGAEQPEPQGGAAPWQVPSSDEDRVWWAFQPVADPVPPQPSGIGEDASTAVVRNAIDAFVVARLEQAGLRQAPEASRPHLIRRATFDLLGVPPTPEEIAAFVDDRMPDAWERVIDRLLADPRYGQRWARHWLDVVRYAESDGYKADTYRPDAWRYRDWVIRAFNDDKPYRDFVLEQLAGDEIRPDDPAALVATGFYRAAVYEYNNRDAEGQQQLILDEITDTVGDVFLGMGMACARCHDHKFDPIPQRDYYRLRAFFEPMIWRDGVPAAEAAALAAHAEAMVRWEERHRDLLDRIAALEMPAWERMEKNAVEKFPDHVQAIYRKPASERNAHEQQIAYLVRRQIGEEGGGIAAALGDRRKDWEALQKELEAVKESRPAPLPTAMAVGDLVDCAIPATRIPDHPDMAPIAPGFLSLLDPDPAAIDGEGVARPGSSGRRTALARWIASPDNPLSVRVIVNRIWQHHFGTGLVENASDFGRLGGEPTHPELLDWLASRFVEDGWRFKPLHRRILLSATWRQTSMLPAGALEDRVDPRNRLLWRYPARRLDAEQIRDAMLAVSGELQPRDGGPSVSANEPVRTIFTKVLRNSPDPLLETFDAPPLFSSASSRTMTTTATQALLMINGAWTQERAGALARKLLRDHGSDHGSAVDALFTAAYGRAPESGERDAAQQFIREQIDFQRAMADGSVAALPADAFRDDPQLQRWGTAFHVGDESPLGRLALPDAEVELPRGGFTIEAIVSLRSLYPDASVRTIAARWTGDEERRGWSFGVTSEKSRHLPRNLILQLVGDPRDSAVDGANAGDRGTLYQVVPSGIRIPSDRPCYVGVAVDFENGTARFFARDLGNSDAPLETVEVAHRIAGGCGEGGVPFTIGARADTDGRRSAWDGLIDEVRLTDGLLDGNADSLIAGGAREADITDTVGYWRFVRAHERGLLADASPRGLDLVPVARGSTETADPEVLALTDLCHALLNSSEFLHVD